MKKLIYLLTLVLIISCGSDNESTVGEASTSNPFGANGQFISTTQNLFPLYEVGQRYVLYLHDTGHWEITNRRRYDIFEDGGWVNQGSQIRLNRRGTAYNNNLLRGILHPFNFKGHNCLRLSDNRGFRVFCPTRVRPRYR